MRQCILKVKKLCIKEFLAYAREYKTRLGKSNEEIEEEMFQFQQTPMKNLKGSAKFDA
ncbi:hypothetical protein GCM10020331_027830 [Ectobacillus funiculus]